MNLNEYQRLAWRTAKVFDILPMDLAHASLGLVTETGEFTTEVKRAVIYGKEISEEMRQHMVEELGDIMWYIALAATHLDTTLSTIAKQNVAKLAERFPDKYTDQAAEARADKGGADARSS